MSDPIEELSNFDPGVPVNPLPAAEVRARGERLRRRNTALVIVGAVAAVVLVAVPVAVFARGDDGAEPQPAKVLTDSVLLTAAELPIRDRLTDWRQADAEGEVLACAPEPVSSLDPQSSVRRDFAADIARAPAEGPPSSVVRTSVLQFDDETAARAAYDAAFGWVLGCPGVDNVNRDSAEWRVDVADGGQGEWRMRSYVYPDACGDTDCDAALFDRMGVAQFDNRVVLVSLAEVGGPLEPGGLDESMLDLVVAAVNKAGGRSNGGSGGGEEIIDTSPTRLDVPLDWDLVDMTGDGGQILGPGPKAQGVAEVSPCDRDVWPATGVDRLALTTTGPEFIESRELVVFNSADRAAATMEGVRSAIADCPNEINEQDPTTSPEQAWDVLQADTGYDDSVTFSLTYSDGLPGGQVWQLTRVGKAIIAVSTGGAYSRGQSAASATPRLTEITDHMTPEMCEYTEGGC